MSYKRILLKLSGEALMGNQAHSIDPVLLTRVAREIKTVVESGVQPAIVIGGGNILRGTSALGKMMNRVTADYIGMLATVINALALADTLKSLGVNALVQSAIEMPRLCELTNPLRAGEHLERGGVVIFGGGTGTPFFTTDTTAALRAGEIRADAVMKATKVDGVYSSDPKKHPNAKRFDTITFNEVIRLQLEVMDLTAITLCRENNLPIVVFNMTSPGTIERVLRGEAVCTTVVPE